MINFNETRYPGDERMVSACIDAMQDQPPIRRRLFGIEMATKDIGYNNVFFRILKKVRSETPDEGLKVLITDTLNSNSPTFVERAFYYFGS